jgi:hypothetical protein
MVRLSTAYRRLALESGKSMWKRFSECKLLTFLQLYHTQKSKSETFTSTSNRVYLNHGE